MKRKIVTILILFCACINQVAADSGTLSGVAFLKTMPGARAQSMAGAYTAVVDDPGAIYANPGAAGFTREWQWSTSYTKWFADVSNASVFFAARLRTPWSRYTRLAAGLLYQGVPEFDSTNDLMPVVSSSDAVASISIGQPLSFISHNLSIGTNLKYLDSKLAEYSASGFVFDAGLLGRTNTFNIFGKEAAFSFGYAVNQMGQDLVFLEAQTPLPLTRRAGLGFYFGSFSGSRFLITTDYIQIKDKEDYLAIGAEALIKRRFAVNVGWDFGLDLLQKFTAGASIRLDDTGSLFSKRAQNQTLRMDFATLNDDRFVGRTYRGTVTHSHNHPEGFRFVNWFRGDSLRSPDVTLVWEGALDRDVFDAVRYHVFVSQDRNELVQVMQKLQNSSGEFESFLQDSSFCYAESTRQTFATFNSLKGGDWYWIVAALDRDDHIRFANVGRSRRKIAHFCKPLPDVCLRDFRFDYYRTIDESDYHGKISFDVANCGASDAFGVNVNVDILAGIAKHILMQGNSTDSLFWSIDTLKAFESRTIEFDWHTPLLGAHRFIIDAGMQYAVEEEDKANNQLDQVCYTVPKGYIASPDSNVIELLSEVSIEMPIITVVDFAAHSAKVPHIYLNKVTIDPHLVILADRLKANPGLSIDLTGTINKNLNEFDTSLANARAMAVRDSLIRIGVASSQINVLPPRIHKKERIPGSQKFKNWVNEERCSVLISADKEAQKKLFLPIRHHDYETVQNDAFFDLNIQYAVRADNVFILLENESQKDTISIVGQPLQVVQDVFWRPQKDNPSVWFENSTSFSAIVKDSLSRIFYTPLQSTQFTNKSIERQIRRIIPFVFEKTDPTYDVFWEQLYNQARKSFIYSDARMRIEGHCCELDAFDVNEKLSQERATTFYNEFLSYVQRYHEKDYNAIKKRIDPPRGCSDQVPLGIKRLDGSFILFGDNNLPIGRKMNRRIEINFYMTEY